MYSHSTSCHAAQITAGAFAGNPFATSYFWHVYWLHCFCISHRNHHTLLREKNTLVFFHKLPIATTWVEAIQEGWHPRGLSNISNCIFTNQASMSSAKKNPQNPAPINILLLICIRSRKGLSAQPCFLAQSGLDISVVFPRCSKHFKHYFIIFTSIFLPSFCCLTTCWVLDCHVLRTELPFCLVL